LAETQPVREKKVNYSRCHCRIIRRNTEHISDCTNNTQSPDRPFCDFCETRHGPGQGWRDPIYNIITTY
jgi:hypothetical protein